MLGVLVPVLRLDRVAFRRRFVRNGETAFVVPARIYGRPVSPLLSQNKREAGRLPASV
jgi:hypothetical protein